MKGPIRMFLGSIALLATAHNACAIEAILWCDSFKLRSWRAASVQGRRFRGPNGFRF